MIRRTTKVVQLWLNQHFHRIRYWLVVTGGIMLLIFSMANLINSNRLNQRLDTATQKIQVLSEQNKALNKDNKASSKRIETVVLQSREYARCIAELQAKNSRDDVGYTIENLDTCAVRSQNGIENFNPQPGTAAPGGATQPRSGATSPAAPTQGTPGATGATGPQGSPGVSPAPAPVPAPQPQAIIPLAPAPLLPCILGICLL